MKITKNKTKAAQPRKMAPSEDLKEELMHFVEYHQAGRFSRNLRKMLIEFLMYEGATEANYLMDLLYDLEGLFQLLDVIQSEATLNKSIGRPN